MTNKYGEKMSSRSEQIVTREVFEKVLEKAKNNPSLRFPSLLVNISDAIEIFKNDENCKIVLSLSPEPSKYLNMIAAANSKYFEKIENLNLIKDLKFSDYNFFNESYLGGEIGDFFLDLALKEKNNSKGKVNKIKREAWIANNDERVFKAIKAGVFNYSELLMINWSVDNEKHVNFIKNELTEENVEIFKYVPVEMFKSSKLSANAVVLIVSKSIVNKDVKAILSFAKENMGDDKFEKSIKELIEKNSFNYVNLSHIFEKKYMDKFKSVFLNTQVSEYPRNGFRSFNSFTIDIKDVENFYVNKIDTHKKLMFFYKNYQENFVNSSVLVEKVDFKELWKDAGNTKSLSVLVEFLNTKSVFSDKLKDFIQENKEDVLNDLKNSGIDVSEPMNKFLEEVFKDRYLKEYFKNEQKIIDSECFRNSEWVLGNMDIQSFHDALLKTAGSYKNVGKILAYDQHYDDVLPRYEQFNDLSEVEFVKKFIGNILNKPSKSLKM